MAGRGLLFRNLDRKIKPKHTQHLFSNENVVPCKFYIYQVKADVLFENLKKKTTQTHAHSHSHPHSQKQKKRTDQHARERSATAPFADPSPRTRTAIPEQHAANAVHGDTHLPRQACFPSRPFRASGTPKLAERGASISCRKVSYTAGDRSGGLADGTP